MINNITDRIHSILNSKGFFKFVIIFFIIEASWIALTAIYPQAFDEQYHFGLIKLYSHHLWPFFSKQPAGANQFGAVAVNSSYLYHYLMSFPYRFIELITKNQDIQIIILRFIDIAMFTYGLILFRKVLLKTRLSKAMSNLIIFVFILIPIVPQLAGQVNYDDLMIPLVAAVCLLSFNMIDQIKKHQLSFKTTALMLILATFTSLVKFAFLPIYLAVVLFFVFYIYRYHRSYFFKIWNSFILDFKKQSLKLKIVLISLLLISVAMFAQRDLVNIVKYHSLNPSCSSVLSIKDCKAYPVWYANYIRHKAIIDHKKSASDNIIVYIGQWLYWMWYRLFFAVNGPGSHFTNYPPLPLPSAMALIVGVSGLIVAIKYRKKILKANPYVILLFLMSLIYLIALITQGYSTYRFTAVLENMNGRYLLPILILIGAILARAFSLAFKKYGHLKVIAACITIIMLLEGGGIFTYIIRSNDSWYWHSNKVVKVNKVVRKITKKVVVTDKKSYATKVWFFN
jgi:hypothetical protein